MGVRAAAGWPAACAAAAAGRTQQRNRIRARCACHTSHAGLSSSARTSFTLDILAPGAAVSDGAGGASESLACVNVAEPLSCSWSGVQDELSGVRSLEWAIGTAPFASNAPPDVQPFTSLSPRSLGSACTAAAVNASVGTQVHCILRVVDRAGMETIVSSRGARLVEPTCNEPFVCVA